MIRTPKASDLWGAYLRYSHFEKLFVTSFFKNLLTNYILRDMMYYVTGGMIWIFN